MLFKRLYDQDLAQASYFIGCQASGEAIVVDPHRDIEEFLRVAEDEGMVIKAVTETHIHADYLSGALELASHTGAQLYLSDEGNADWKYGFEGTKLYHGSEINLGNITLKAVHTPGHTPEHLSFLVTDGATAHEPGFILTGDFVFVGDIGRPDLLDEAAGGKDTRFEGAKQLFKSLQEHFLSLPDYVQVWPGHGAGSACGKALGAVASSTVGYERRFAWWAGYLDNNDEAGFIEALLEGQPDAPLYFGRMKRHNKAGPALLGELPPLTHHSSQELAGNIPDEILLIDTRAREVVEQGAVPGALHVPAGNKFVTYASYVIDPEKDQRPIVLLANDQAQAEGLRKGLIRVGIDNVKGYLSELEHLPQHPVATVSAAKLDTLANPLILDVRSKSEFAAGHIPGAKQLHAGRLMWHLDQLPNDQTIVTHCQTGVRSAVAASALRSAGFEHVLELAGSYQAWEAFQQETVAAH